MRYVVISTLVLAGIATMQAEIVSFSFSGTWGSSLGPVTAGQTFSGTAEWDPGTVGAVVPNFAELTFFSFTMPAGDGFNVPGPLPNSQILFAGAGYTGSTFDGLQVNEVSTADSKDYVFFVKPTGGSTGGVAFKLNTGTVFDFSVDNQASGPNVVPEPSKISYVVLGLGLIAAAVRHSLMTRRWKDSLKRIGLCFSSTVLAVIALATLAASSSNRWTSSFFTT
jgi:hypothetical protein